MVIWLKKGGMALDKDEQGDIGGNNGPGDNVENGSGVKGAGSTNAVDMAKVMEEVVGYMEALSLDVSHPRPPLDSGHVEILHLHQFLLAALL